MSQSVLTLDATIFTHSQLADRMALPEAATTLQIALAGRSNVGKSSLVNALANRKKLAKVSSTPGKTRSINYYTASPENFWLVDLPGYGYARCSREEQKKWIELTNLYLTTTPMLRALTLLLDCRLPPQAADQQLTIFAREHNITLLPVLTKADKVKQREQAKRQHEWSILLDGTLPLLVSSREGRGLDALWQAMRERLGSASPTSPLTPE